MLQTESEQKFISQVEQLTVDQWGEYKNLRLRALQSDPSAFGRSYKDELLNTEEDWKHMMEQSQLCFARDISTNELVGMIGAYSTQEGVYTFNQMWVDQAFRGRGISKDLFKEMLARVKGLGAKKVELYVSTVQEAPIGLYKKLGFEIVETLPEQTMGDGSVVDEYRMELDLI